LPHKRCGGAASAQVGPIGHVVVQERRGMQELDYGGQLDVVRAVAEAPRAQQN
jgi:hypothetical protein